MIEPRNQVISNNQSTDEALRAGIYARTSSNSRKYGHSLDEQVEKGIERCDQLGWEVAFVFRDEAESGKDTDRPMFQQLLHASERQFIDVVVFWRLDRFSRSLIHAVQLESRLRENEVYLYSLTEQIDTTSPTGRFNFRNIASAAEYERDIISQRSSMTVDALASKTKWPNGNPPLGYRITSDGRLTVDENESKLVKRIFQLYIELRSMGRVATTLKEENVPSSDGGEWTAARVGEVLRNRIYVGYYEVGDVSKRVDEYQIVDRDTFEEVTKIRHRFQEQRSSVRRMEFSRKSKMANKILDQYREYINLES